MRILLSAWLILILIVNSTINVRSQNIDTSWTRTYGGDHHDYATSLLQTGDDGYLLTGITYSYGAGDKDVFLVKTNSWGDTAWTRTYGDTLIDNVFSIRSTYDGGYVIGGWSSSFSGDNRDFDCYILKLDWTGSLEWQSYCTDSSNCGAYDIVQADDGGYVLAGAAKSLNQTMNFDMFIVRADQFGDTIWTRRYIVPGRELWDGLAYSITKTSDGCYVAAGEINFRRENHSDIYVIKINDSGDTLWTRIIDHDLLEYAWDCAETPDEDIVITGWTWGGFPDTTGDHVYLARLARDGELIWQKFYAYEWPGLSYNDGWAVVVDPVDSGYIIAADTRQAPVSARDIYILKTDSDGGLLWSSKIGDYHDESPFNVIITSDNGFAVCGQKYVLNSHGYYYKDIYLLKFESSTGIPYSDYSLPENIGLIGNHPNPFNSYTIFKYFLPKSSNVKIEIYDFLGRRIAAIYGEFQQDGYHQLKWNADDIPSGIYLYKLQAGDYTSAKKMTLLK